MARRNNQSFLKRQKERERKEKAERKRERRMLRRQQPTAESMQGAATDDTQTLVDPQMSTPDSAGVEEARPPAEPDSPMRKTE
ncbi:MAG: hypothetical protein JSW67_05745 [Candidatus Latescibacterota bacterium]|nr:MAG: hypothetical protein JSW67_05745 [Candidatus Latescibacterota bacterium]